MEKNTQQNKNILLGALLVIGSVLYRLSKLFFIVLIVWALLFAIYINEVFEHDDHQAGLLPPADAIIVLTGGEGRIDYGVQLLSQGVAPVLFVSGVSETARKADLFPSELLSMIEIETEAKNTAGNSEAIKDWLEQKDIDTLILVTSDYHMPRALDVLRRNSIEQTIHLAPVPYITKERLKNSPRAYLVLFYEFHKYLYQRLTGLTEI